MRFPWHPLERMDAAVRELESRPGHEIFDRVRDQHLARAGERGDARADMDGDAAALGAHHLAFAGMASGPHLEAERPYILGDRRRAAHGTGWPVEGREEPVAGRVDLAPAEAREVAAHERVVSIQHLVPTLVAER